ncbi:AGE family epimerase/isomerase [bacterium]|nr:AGE family epimerase/isomerase [bacterium]
MKRRSFFGATAGTAAALSGIGGCQTQPRQSGQTQPQQPMAVCADGKLAGKTLEELRSSYMADLNEFKEFQHKYVVDKEYGGFCLHTDWDGPPLSWEKRSWYEGRGTWTFSHLFNRIDPDPRNLEAAKRSVDFVMKHLPKEDVFFPAYYSREGKAGDREVNIYGDMFIATGFCEYSKAKGNEQYWDIGKDIMKKCMRLYDQPGYNKTELTPNGTRSLGHWFITLHFITQMLENRDDPELKAVADRCIESQMKYHYNPDYGLYNEEINHDFTRPNNRLAQYGSLGHSSEMLWMTLYEAVRRKDKALFDENAARFRRTLEVAWDDVYGGVFIMLENVDENKWDVGKAGWGQMEDLNGLMCIIEHTGADWAKEWFDKLHTWVYANFPLKPYGLPLWQDYTDRKAVFVKGDKGRRAENLHHPRHLMLNMEAVERIMKRGGKVSGVFGA